MYIYSSCIDCRVGALTVKYQLDYIVQNMTYFIVQIRFYINSYFKDQFKINMEIILKSRPVAKSA